MKTWKVEAAIIAVGMVLLGVIIKWGINDFTSNPQLSSSASFLRLNVLSSLN